VANLAECLQPGRWEAGCDEAGRGCLAGPVAAAAVILPDNADFLGELNDSKQLTPEKRASLATAIENESEAYAIKMVDNHTIDRINILQASVKAMNQALGALSLKPEYVLVDGNYFHTDRELPYQCVKKGDATYKSIAAASILAKHHRDQLMIHYHDQHPAYDWASNKGYATAKHLEALRWYGPSRLHRYSFKRVQPVLINA
jgi:ribonuclease HII